MPHGLPSKKTASGASPEGMCPVDWQMPPIGQQQPEPGENRSRLPTRELEIRGILPLERITQRSRL